MFDCEKILTQKMDLNDKNPGSATAHVTFFFSDFPPVEDDRSLFEDHYVSLSKTIDCVFDLMYLLWWNTHLRWVWSIRWSAAPMAALGFTIRVSCLLQLTAFFSRDTTCNATFVNLII
ncbi:hypothetical protein Hanom_Chr04g00332751 [Helianthus anomalus]